MNPWDESLTYLHRRVARLLLRHDRATFRGTFREFYCQSCLPLHPVLAAYDQFIRLVALADELLDDILPRIQRQMSFHSPRTRRYEEAPLRGQVDWERTMTRTLQERPDLSPTAFSTQMRNRSFDTPENELVTAIVTAYIQALQPSQTHPLFALVPPTEGEQRELTALSDRLRRELSALPLCAGGADTAPPDILSLALLVEKRLPPGPSPYRDVLTWWQRFEHLHQHNPADAPTVAVLGTHSQTDTLYTIWLVLELVEFLQAGGLLKEIPPTPDQLSFTFLWEGQCYRFLHQRQPAAHMVWQGMPATTGWSSAIIVREPALTVDHQGVRIWQEPGVVIRPAWGEDSERVVLALQHILADMHLSDAPRGVLLLPVLADADTETDADMDANGSYQVAPSEERFLGSQQRGSAVLVSALCPHEQEAEQHRQIAALLCHVAAWLPDRPAISCYGFLQDADTRNPAETQPRRCKQCGEVLALCPRPHCGPDSAGLVCPRCDCLRNPRLCHLLSLEQPHGMLPPFVKRVMAQDELLETVRMVRERLQQQVPLHDESDTADVARSTLFRLVGEVTDSYVRIATPDTGQIEYVLREGFFPACWDAGENPRRLSDEVRNMLISGDYVRSRFRQTTVKDWAACAVQYLRALEHEMRRRLYEPCKPHLHNRQGLPMGYFCFGMPGAAYRGRSGNDHNQHNWETFLTHVVARSGASPEAFVQLLCDIEALRQDRNAVAHTASVDRGLSERVRTIVLGDIGRAGLLRRLIELLAPPE